MGILIIAMKMRTKFWFATYVANGLCSQLQTIKYIETMLHINMNSVPKLIQQDLSNIDRLITFPYQKTYSPMSSKEN